jgi:hypothetical protein
MSKQLRQRYYRNSIQNLRNSNPFNWWRQTRRLTAQVSRPELTALANCEAGGDIQWPANLINNSLQHVSSDLSPLSDTALSEIEPISPEYIIHPYEVFRKLSQIKTEKSPGPDGIPNWFLRDFAFAISEPICHIFNASIQHGTVPACWKMANVIPISKVRPSNSFHDDLRPISLTPTLSKILESFIGQWMLSAVVDKFDRR